MYEDFAQRAMSIAKATLIAGIKLARAEIDSVSIEGVTRVIKNGIDAGLAAHAHQERDLNEHLAIWIERASWAMETFLLDTEVILEFIRSLEECWRVLGAAGLLKMVHGRASDNGVLILLTHTSRPAIEQISQPMQMKVGSSTLIFCELR